MYKLLLLDIDGTVVGRDMSLSQAVKRAVCGLRETGVKVCLCTGRNLKSALYVAEQLELDTYIATLDGTTIYSMEKRETVYANCLSYEANKEIFNLSEQKGLIAVAATDSEFLHYAKSTAEIDEILSFGRTPEIKEVYEKYWGITCTDNKEIFLRKLTQTREISFRSLDDGKLISLKAELEAKESSSDFSVRHLDDMLIVGAKAVSKARAMKELCAVYGISIAEVVAVGDERNDISMISEAGMGVAMGNAHDEVKKVSDYITRPVNEDGVVEVINRFWYNRP